MTTLAIQSVYQGDTATLDFIAQTYTGAPQNLTGCAIRWAISDPANTTVPLLSKTHQSGITIVDAVAGRLSVNIAPGDTSDLSGAYRQELEITLPTGATYTYAQGPFVIKPTIYPEQA